MAAVSLVIIHHWGASIDSAFARLAAQSGWVGVDLFFVLSGFLVSGLIFREHQQHDNFDGRRFLIRRGLKIYPAFYVLLLASVVGQSSLDLDVSAARVLAEGLFVQNYADGIWDHTWSLAIEEHFYLMLALAAAIMSRRGALGRARHLVGGIAVVCAAILGLRIINALFVDYEWDGVYTPTHLRIDSLLVGVAISYVYHYRPSHLLPLVERRRLVFVAAGLLLLTPCVIFDRDDPMMYTFGLTSLSLGFGALMISILTSARAAVRLAKAPLRHLAFLGRYSYSVYLWHSAVMIVLRKVVRSDVSPWLQLALDLSCSFVVGIVMARLVEVPMLVLRDRWYPSRSDALPRRGVARRPRRRRNVVGAS